MDDYNVENIFTYHKPIGDQPERYEKIRNKAKELAILILESCPKSREKLDALVRLEEAIMWSNASIARNESKEFGNYIYSESEGKWREKEGKNITEDINKDK